MKSLECLLSSARFVPMKKILLKVVLGLIGFLVAGFVFVEMGFRNETSRLHKVPDFTIHEEVSKADLALGKRMYTVRNGCIDCHGPDLSGKLVMQDGGMGTIYGANLTPFALKDRTDEDIARAIRYGIHKDGRSLRFMPSFDYKSLSKGDLAALIAYIRSVPPVERLPAENHFGPVAKVLSLAGKMPVMFPANSMDLSQGFGEKPEEGPTAAFGKYLAQSCVGCHGQEYRGGKIEGGDPAWPEAASIRLGANPIWTEASFTEAIRSGVSPTTKARMRVPMPVDLLQQMNDTEMKALWEYLKTLN